MPVPPNPPEGAPPPPTFNQSTEEVKGHVTLLSDVNKGSSLRKVKLDDRSAALLDSKTPTSNPEHPYIRLYQYLHQQTPRQQGAPPDDQRTAAGPSATLSLDKPKGGGAMTVGTNGSEALSSAGVRPVGDGSSGRPPPTRAAAPCPPTHRHDDRNSLASAALSPFNALSRPSTPPSAPPPEPPICRRGNAPLPPSTPDSTLPIPTKPPSSPVQNRTRSHSGGSPASSTLALPPPQGGEPQHHNSLGNKRPAPSPGGHTPTRGPAPLPPSSSPIPQLLPKLAPPPPAPPTPPSSSSSSSSSRAGIREAPPPPYKNPCSPAHCSDIPTRGPPPPPPTRTPAAPPPPPPPLRNGHSSSVHRSFVDDFESKYSFHPLDDFPPPDEFKHFTKIYPSKAGRVMRGAPPLPPVGR